MNILILGGAGMLGHKLFQRLRQSHPETFCTIRGSVNEGVLQRVELFHAGNVIENCDASDSSTVERLLRQHKPAVVINCIGIVKQRAAATKPIPSIEINSLLPHRLASVCDAWRGRFIHFSTDCIFSGQHGNYSEEDFSRRPRSVRPHQVFRRGRLRPSIDVAHFHHRSRAFAP